MGLVHAKITIKNPRKPDLQPITVDALVDSGAIVTCIPEAIALELEVDEHEKRVAKTADAKTIKVPYVGPLQFNFANRSSFGGAMVMGDTVLLGAVQMEDMDLIISSRDQQVTVHPERPNFAGALAMGVRNK